VFHIYGDFREDLLEILTVVIIRSPSDPLRPWEFVIDSYMIQAVRYDDELLLIAYECGVRDSFVYRVRDPFVARIWSSCFEYGVRDLFMLEFVTLYYHTYFVL